MRFLVGNFSMAGQFGSQISRWWFGVAQISDAWDHEAPEACSSLLWLAEEVLSGLVNGERTRPGSQFIVLADVEGAKGLLRGPESCVGILVPFIPNLNR